jgi:benzodiazapine receptor
VATAATPARPILPSGRGLGQWRGESGESRPHGEVGSRLERSAAAAMVAALVILVVMVLVAAGLNPTAEQFRWFLRLKRPRWLSFERWIPLIWISIYVCFYLAALLGWQATGSWRLMLLFLALLLLVQSYTLVICRSRRLANGTVIGLAGWLVGLALALQLLPRSNAAAGLLLPYLLWSPLGTFVTWQMQRLNR